MVTGNVCLLEGFFFEAFRTMATFCVKSQKCGNFGLCGFLRSGFFWFIFWFLCKWRHLLKFLCFLFFKKSDIKGRIVPFKKAINWEFDVTTLHESGKVWMIGAWRDRPKSKKYNSESSAIEREGRKLNIDFVFVVVSSLI